MNLASLGDRHQSSLSDRQKTIFSLLSQLASQVGSKPAKQKYESAIALLRCGEEEVKQVRIIFFAHFILHLTRLHSESKLSSLQWGQQYKLVAQWMEFWDESDAMNAYDLASRIVGEAKEESRADVDRSPVERSPQKPLQPTTDSAEPSVAENPVAEEAESLDASVGQEIHAMGKQVEKVLNQFNYSISYVEEQSRKALRVYRLVFQPGVATSLATIENSSYKNLVGHAGLNPASRLFVCQGRVEVHIPVENPEIPMWTKHGPRQPQYAPEKPNSPIDSVEFVCGVNLDGAVYSVPKAQRILVAGGSGSGKTNSIQVNLASWHLWYSPDQLRLALIDTDGVSLTAFRDSKMLFDDMFCDDISDYLSVLKKVLEIRERRKQAFRQNKINQISQWNSTFPRSRLPYLMVVIEEMSNSADEVDALIEQLKDESPAYKPEYKNANTPVIRLAEVCRKQGIGILVGAQRPAATSIDPRIKNNLDLRVVYQVGSTADSAIAFGVKNENRGFYLQGGGDSFVCHKSQMERCQQFLMGSTEEEAQSYIEQLVEWYNNTHKKAVPNPDDSFLPPLSCREDPSQQKYLEYLALVDSGLSETEVFRQIFKARYPSGQITGSSLKWCKSQVSQWKQIYAE